MNSDRDQRTSKIIQAEVRRTLQEMWDSVCELEIISIRHEEDQVSVQGIFTQCPGELEKRFGMTMPRVDGPLDHFL